LINGEIPSLGCDFERQEEVFGAAFAILRNAISDQAFPAASIAVTHRSRVVALKGFGHFTYEADSPIVNGSVLFDLASLTKVVATTSMAMLLYQRGLLDLDAPVASLVPEFVLQPARDSRRKGVTFHTLLAHSSGLPAYGKLFMHNRTRDELLHSALTMPLVADPGSHAEYSDIGFIILGMALERLAAESLDSFCQREIFASLGLIDTGFNPPRAIRERIAPSADDRTFRQRVIQGEVQDENASVMGGVAGHAGLFSTAVDLAQFAEMMLRGGAPIFREQTVCRFSCRETAPSGTSRALGWDTPAEPSQSGKYFSSSSFGHLGYTGTSLWIDPTRQMSVTLLTNRTWPDCSNHAIKEIRPRFHNAVVEGLQAQRWEK
jgi:CubicO group peptidase (beta-lactamase class C family)